MRERPLKLHCATIHFISAFKEGERISDIGRNVVVCEIYTPFKVILVGSRGLVKNEGWKNRHSNSRSYLECIDLLSFKVNENVNEAILEGCRSYEELPFWRLGKKTAMLL